MYAYRNNHPVTPTKPALPGIFSAMLLALNAAVTSSRSGFAAVGSGLSVVSFVRPVEAEAEAVWAGVTFMAASSYIALSPPTPKAPAAGGTTQRAPSLSGGNTLWEVLSYWLFFGWLFDLFARPKWPGDSGFKQGTNLQNTLSINNAKLPNANDTSKNVSVYVSGNNVYIVTGFSYSVQNAPNSSWKGWDAEKDGTSYKNLLKNGITNRWNRGTNESFTVFGHSVRIYCTIDDSRSSKLTATLNYANASCTAPVGPIPKKFPTGTITMSTGTSGVQNAETNRSQTNFRSAAGHEFGHILGLTHDTANDGQGTVTDSIMQSVANNNGHAVVAKDIEYVIKAYVTGNSYNRKTNN